MPELISKLRWFYEEYPQLPVIAAGSLLEFVLAEHEFSMPVGRISYMHLEPLSFEEFLVAVKKKKLQEYLSQYHWGKAIPAAIHNQLMRLFKEYVIIGGLPAAIACWQQTHSLSEIHQVQYELIATYRDDFAKYSGKISNDRLEEALNAVPKMLGNKIIYSQINTNIQAATVKRAISLLAKARIITPVISTDANGIPLGAELREKVFKLILLDVGLCSNLLGLSLNEINTCDEINLINKGGIAEQVAGQLLRTLSAFYVEPTLYYWHREKKSSNAEIDYLIQQGHKIIPIEVKAGSTGTLKSLHLFMGIKNLTKAVRINSDHPSTTSIDINTSQGLNVKYQLLSIPFYLLEQLPRLIKLNSEAPAGAK